MLNVLSILLVSVFLILTPTSVNAASKKSNSRPTFGATLAKNKRYITVNFSNLSKTKTIKYQLTYDSKKGPQGVSGTLSSKTKSLSRQLTLGTCSKKVCVYHQGVKGIVLNVDYTLKSGGIVSYSKKL